MDKWTKSDSLHNAGQYKKQSNWTDGGGPFDELFGKASLPLPKKADLPAHIRKFLFFQAEDAAGALTGQ